jgi:glycosyltransferase involved in cell wall biosynthesis
VLGRTLDQRMPPRADHVIAVTGRMLHWFTENTTIPGDRISIIPNGVEFEHFSNPDHAGIQQIAGPHIIFAGNLAEYQGVDLLLQAFRQVLESINDAHLSLLTSSNTSDVVLMIERLGLTNSVSFLDPDYASLPTELAAADVLANPRIECDGIPQKLLNYMATGRPIVSFESSAALLEHGRNALIVSDGDINGFSNAILRLIRDPVLAQSLGKAAKSKVLASYGWQKVAERVESIYDRLVGSST